LENSNLQKEIYESHPIIFLESLLSSNSEEQDQDSIVEESKDDFV